MATKPHYGPPDVDLDSETVGVHRYTSGHFEAPIVLGRGHRLEPRELPGFSISADELFGPAEDDAS